MGSIRGMGAAALAAMLLIGTFAAPAEAHAQAQSEGAREESAADELGEPGEASEAAASRGVRIRAGLSGGFALGGAEAQREGGFMLGGTLHARVGAQFDDHWAVYYQAAGYFGGWPQRCEGGGRNCSEYGMALHTSAAMLELTFDWFQIAGGGGFIGGVVAGHPTSGLAAVGRIAYVDGWDRPDRAGFTIGAELMAASLLDGCWAHTTEITVGYEWY